MVHQYKLNGYNIVLDTASGSVHSVDEVAYDIIKLYKEKTTDEIVGFITEKYNVSKDEVLECIEDVKFLEENGKLFSVDEYEDLAIDFKARNTVIKALCLHIFQHHHICFVKALNEHIHTNFPHLEQL